MGEAEVIPLGARTGAKGTPTTERPRCKATTATGRPCRNHAVDDGGYCRVHKPDERTRPIAAPRAYEEDVGADSALGRLRSFVRRRLAGTYPIDDFGYDRELAREILLPLMRPLYERYFRVKTLGMDRVPSEGPALLVANHSGTVALDSLIMQFAVASEHPQERVVRNVGADLVFRLPFIGPMARKTGNVVACEEDAHELIRRGELVGVFPEGYKGVGKGWRERYRLQRFGRGGFMEIALRERVPIIPVAMVVPRRPTPMIADVRVLAKALGVPYFPITPTFPLLGPLGLIPLPSRWIIEFGEPIPMDDYPEDAAEDKMLVFDLADEVRDTIQQLLYKNLKYRGGTFL